MKIRITHHAGWISLICCLFLFCTAARPGTGSASSSTTHPLGTTFWIYRDVTSVFTAAWSPDGKYLALGDGAGTVQIRKALTGATVLTIRGHANHVWAVAWSPDGKRLASASWDQTVQMWDAATGKHLMTYRGHDDIVCAIAWSPDSKRIASAAYDLRIWQAL